MARRSLTIHFVFSGSTFALPHNIFLFLFHSLWAVCLLIWECVLSFLSLITYLCLLSSSAISAELIPSSKLNSMSCSMLGCYTTVLGSSWPEMDIQLRKSGREKVLQGNTKVLWEKAKFIARKPKTYDKGTQVIAREHKKNPAMTHDCRNIMQHPPIHKNFHLACTSSIHTGTN